jgi:hypothetical protein
LSLRRGLRQLPHQLAALLRDLPLFLFAPAIRGRHLRWGATHAEVAARLPGDDQVPGAQFVATRAIDIAVPPAGVWPWLVQVGAGRAGWYSHDLLDNLGKPSATEIIAPLQHLAPGDWVPMSPFGTPSEKTAFRVESMRPPELMVWTKPDSVWVWQLTATPAGTRLVTRVHVRYDWRRPWLAVFGALLMEFGDFAMQRRMLRGIKQRAESLARRGSSGPS